MTIFQAIRGFFSPSFKQEMLDVEADILAEKLSREPRQEICFAQSNPKVIAARRFLKNHGHRGGAHIAALKSELVAAKLGIRRHVFDANPGFEQFAEKNHLDRYLLKYEDRIGINAEKKIVLRVKEEHKAQSKRWDEVKLIIENFKKRTITPSQSWVYGPLGVQNKDMYSWKKLRPYRYEDPSAWKKKYIFEVCVFLTGSTRSIAGNHSWLRLKTPAGHIYSVGLYRNGAHQQMQQLLRVMPGELMSPDVSEFWPGQIRSLQIEITKESFTKVITNIESDKAAGTKRFEDFDTNCTFWLLEKAKIAGLHLNGSENLLTLMLPRKVEAIAQTVWRYIPMKKLFEPPVRIATALCVNSLQVLLGAGKVDSRLKQGTQPRFALWRDLFDPRKMVVYHPYALADKTISQIETWRTQEIERVKRENPPDLARRIDTIAFSVPQA